MKVIYHVTLCDDDVGECEGFYDEAGQLLASWDANDANWRGEYMDGLLEALGITVAAGTKKHEKAFRKHMKDLYS